MGEWDQIWRGLRAGDPTAYERVLERLGRGVWAYLRRMTGRDDLADEVFSRTWLRLVQTAHRIKSPRAIRQYVLAIARRQWLDELEARSRDVLETANAAPADDAAASATPSAFEALAREEDSQRLREAIDRLPVPRREVVVLRVYAELTFKEIAGLLDLPLGTVLTRMRLATQHLANELVNVESKDAGRRTDDERTGQPRQATNLGR
jgi:RNA polymerase sigma-70 factor, ECF subfamily